MYRSTFYKRKLVFTNFKTVLGLIDSMKIFIQIFQNLAIRAEQKCDDLS